MSKVYVIMVTSWNGESEVTSIYSVWGDKEKADAIVSEANSNRKGSYSSSYEVDEHEVNV